MSKLNVGQNAGYTKSVNDTVPENYPNTIVEAIYWDKEKRPLGEVLEDIESRLSPGPEPPQPDPALSTPFTIEATVDGTTVYFRQSPFAVNDGIAPLTVEVSTDDGATWTEITAAPAEDEVPGTTLATLNTGEKALIRGNNPAYGYSSPEGSMDDWIDNCNFWSDQPCYVYGNIMSLTSKDGFETLSSVNECAFGFFFSDYSGELDWSWVLSKDDNPLLLPATTLSDDCYSHMFSYCTALTTAPVLPATTLASYCYNYMFYYCNSLTTAPELPATTLANGCYQDMFRDCSNLSSSPVLPAITLAKRCYRRMFRGCSALNKITCLATDKSAQECTSDWVKNVASSGTFIKSPDAIWTTGDNGIPTGWAVKDYEDTGNVSVTTAPMSLTEAQKEQVWDNIGMPIIQAEGYSDGDEISGAEAAPFNKALAVKCRNGFYPRMSISDASKLNEENFSIFSSIFDRAAQMSNPVIKNIFGTMDVDEEGFPTQWGAFAVVYGTGNEYRVFFTEY